VRGLDYYTRTVFEFVSENVGTQGTICGGGRYDGLIAAMGGQPTPGIGFALGVERLLMELAAQQIALPPPSPLTLYLAILGQTDDQARALCFRLRQAGLRVETDLLDRSLKAQMKYAGKSGAQFILVLGEDEAQSGRARLRSLIRDDLETWTDLDDLPVLLARLQDQPPDRQIEVFGQANQQVSNLKGE
jgi:histidyl-tRNA synthetase